MTRALRILYFSRAYTSHDERFLRMLAASAHEIHFLRLEPATPVQHGRPLPPGVGDAGALEGERRGSSPDEWLSLVPAYDAVIDRVRPDVVQAGPVQSCGLIAVASDRRPVVVVSWGSDLLLDADRDAQWHEATTRSLAGARLFVCDSDAVRHRAEQLAGTIGDRVVQFPWGIDVRTFTPGPDRLGLRQRPGWEGSSIVLSTRSWEPLYRIDVTLEAFRLAQARAPRLRLVLLGDGSLRDAVARSILEHGLERVVLCPGSVPHDGTLDYFRAADIYLSTSRSDGTSISLLEAMATGLAVVATDIPGNREWISSAEHGWLAPEGDAVRFAEHLGSAAGLDPAARARMRHANRAVVEARADWDLASRTLIRAYDRLERDLAAEGLAT